MVEHYLDTVGVTGSNPVSRTIFFVMRAGLLIFCTLALAGCGGGYAGYKTAPYTVRGQRYHPMSPQDALGYSETGTASHYRHGFLIFPGTVAIGEKIYPWSSGAAHKTLPLPCRVRVTNLENGRSVKVRVNDRGPGGFAPTSFREKA